jgi:hypothetical protein
MEIVEYAMERRTDPVGYVERALASGGSKVPPEIRARLESRIREHRTRERGAQPTAPEAGACFDLTPEQAKARVAALASIT